MSVVLFSNNDNYHGNMISNDNFDRLDFSNRELKIR